MSILAMKATHKKLIKKALAPLFHIQILRYLFAFYLYRKIVIPSEKIIALRKNEATLGEDYWSARLRKFAHIVDKGLQRVNFEPGHSARVYKLAKHARDRVTRAQEGPTDPTVVWAREKIQEHESRQRHGSSGETIPFVRTSCSYEDILDIIKTRRSVRRYLSRPVTDDTIKQIVGVIDWCANSCNRQTARVFATNNPDIVRQCTAQCVGARGFGDYIPLFLCFCSDIRPYEMPHEAWLPYVDVALGIQNCILVAHSLGITISTLTAAQHSREQEMELRRIFGIPEYCQLVVNAVGGYPECGAPVPARKSLDPTLSITK